MNFVFVFSMKKGNINCGLWYRKHADFESVGKTLDTNVLVVSLNDEILLLFAVQALPCLLAVIDAFSKFTCTCTPPFICAAAQMVIDDSTIPSSVINVQVTLEGCGRRCGLFITSSLILTPLSRQSQSVELNLNCRLNLPCSSHQYLKTQEGPGLRRVSLPGPSSLFSSLVNTLACTVCC